MMLIVTTHLSLIKWFTTYVCMFVSSVQSVKSEFFSFLPSFMAGRLDWTTLTVEKNWVRICLYCLKSRKFGQLIIRRIIKIVATAHQMSDFKAKMHQIQFRLGLCPRPRWGSLQRPQAPCWI